MNDGPDTEDGAVRVRLADVAPMRVRWVWDSRIPRGKLTILEGDPQLGKSTVTLDLAARVTTGRPMPEAASTSQPRDVILLSAEDGLADTIRPRLDAAGANVERVTAIPAVRVARHEEWPALSEHLAEIEAVVVALDAAMLVIDPLAAYLGPAVNSFSDHKIRTLLGPVAQMAERTGVAIVIIRHLSKPTARGTRAMYRGAGSIGIIGAARSAMLVGKDPDDDGVQVVAMTKCNLAVAPPSLQYRLVDTANGHARVEWLGTSDLTADDLVLPPQPDEDRSALGGAVEVLRQILSVGPVPAKDAMHECEEAGISRRTLDRAKKRLGVVARQPRGLGTPWIWRLPGPGEGRRHRRQILDPDVLAPKE